MVDARIDVMHNSVSDSHYEFVDAQANLNSTVRISEIYLHHMLTSVSSLIFLKGTNSENKRG